MGNATTFAELIAAPNSEKVFLCEAKPGEVLQNWAKATVTLAGFTCNISLVNGTAFITNPSVDLTDYLGWKITITAGGKTLIGYVKAAGSGETFSSNLLTGWTNSGAHPYETFASSGANVTSAINTAAGTTHGIAGTNLLNAAGAGKLFKLSLTETLNSGTAPFLSLATNAEGADGVYNASTLTVNGANSFYKTWAFANTYAIFFNNGTQGNFSTADTEIKQALAPSATGVTIVSTQGGSAYNWTSDDGIDPNAASFTATLEAPYTYEVSYLNETITLADGSTEALRKSVVTCEVDGSALTAKISILEVEATAGTYWHDTATGLIYIHPTDDGSPNHHTVIVYFWVYFATKGIVLDSRYYEPYIAPNGIPALSQESQSLHWGASQISSGAVVLLNNRGFFDQIIKRWIWNNKEIKILLGGDSLPYSEYASVFAGRILQSRFTKADFTLDIQSKAFALLRSLPINNFWTSTWANLDPAAEGKPIPYYWGSYSAAQAPIVTCVNTVYGTNIYQFKICDCAFHAIKSIAQVYIDYGDGIGWQAISHANEDLTNGTFTITAASFVLRTSRVKVAFEGYHSGGTLIEGAPEFVEDLLLNQCGYAAGDLNAPSFTASKAISDCALNVAIEKEISALNVIEMACQSDLAFFDEDGSGLLRYRTWEPVVNATVPVIAKEDILEPPQIEDDTTQLYWKTKIGYSRLNDTGEYLYAEASNSESKYKYGRDDHLTINTYLRSKGDADQLAGRLNFITRDPSPVITLQLKAGLISKTLGDRLQITLARAPNETAGGYIQKEFELISRVVSCFPLLLTLKGRDVAGFGANVGFWMDESAPDWATATAAERDDSGFWSDDDGLIDPAAAESKNKSLLW